MKVTVKGLACRCPECGDEVLPREMEITRKSDIYFWYRCRCGWIWKEDRTPDIVIAMIGYSEYSAEAFWKAHWVVKNGG